MKILFYIMICALAIFSSCKNENVDDIECGFRYDYYQPYSYNFPAEGGVDSVWSPNVVLVNRCDTTVEIGTRARSLKSDTLSNNVLVHHGTWYEIEASSVESGFMKIRVQPNEGSEGRYDQLEMLLYDYYKTRPHRFNQLEIQQEGKDNL